VGVEEEGEDVGVGADALLALPTALPRTWSPAARLPQLQPLPPLPGRWEHTVVCVCVYVCVFVCEGRVVVFACVCACV